MRSVSALGIRSVRRSFGRYVLTTVGASLGVAVLFGVLITNAGISRGLDDALGSSRTPSVNVQAAGTYGGELPASVLDQAAALADVRWAYGGLWINASRQTTGQRQDVFLRAATPRKGPDADKPSTASAPPPKPADIKGRAPAANADEVGLTRDGARALGLDLGSTLEVTTPSGPVKLAVVRIVEGYKEDHSGIVSVETARRLAGKGEVYDSIYLELSKGASVAAFVARNESVFGPSVRLNGNGGDDARGAVKVIQSAFAGLGLMAMFVGAFLIYLTLSSSVAERARTWGVLRAVGAQRRSVLRVVLAEAVAIGVLATILGMALGLGFGSFLLKTTATIYNVRAPRIALPMSAILTAAVLGVLAPAMAAFLPARRAARAEPVDAMRGLHVDAASSGRLWIAGVVIFGAGVVFGVRPQSSTVVTSPLLLMLGAVLMLPPVLTPIARGVGRLTSRLSPGLGNAAIAHLVRERRRSAYTLGLVMVVLAMTLALLSLQSSIMGAVQDAFRLRFGIDVNLYAPGALDDPTSAALRRVDGVADTTVFGFGRVQVVGGKTVELTVIDGATFFNLQGLPWADGNDRDAARALIDGGAVLVPEAFAQQRGLHRGSSLPFVTSGGSTRPFKVGGVYRSPEPLVRVLVGFADAGRYFGSAKPSAMSFRAAHGVSPEVLKTRIERQLGGRGGYFVSTSGGEERRAAERVQQNFQPFLAVVLVAGLVGMLGLANTLGMSILRRTRELGVLRAVGIARRDLQAMVLVEAVTMGLVACALAVPIGWLLTSALLRSTGTSLGFVVTLRPPWILLPATAIVALVISAVASVGPARRVSRLDPVLALRFE